MKITQKQKRLVAGLIPVWRRTVKIEDIAEVLGSSILEAANVCTELGARISGGRAFFIFLEEKEKAEKITNSASRRNKNDN